MLNPCNLFVVFFYDSSHTLFFLFILQDYFLFLLLHNHNDITSVLPLVHWLISLYLQKLPGSKRHWLREAKLLLARRNSQILLFWSKVVCEFVCACMHKLAFTPMPLQHEHNCISSGYFGPFLNPVCLSTL